MTTLAAALVAIKPALESTARQAEPSVLIGRGRVAAYNGQIGGICPCDVKHDDIAVNAERFAKIWTDGSKISIAEQFITVTTKGTRYKLPKLQPETIFVPEMPEPVEELSAEALAGLLLAHEFASKNAQHSWACTVTIRGRRAYATNNVAAVAVDCPTDIEGTFPFWAVNAIAHAKKTTPKIEISSNTITLGYENGTRLKCLQMATEADGRLFSMIGSLLPQSLPLAPYKAVLDDLTKLGGRVITFDCRSIRTNGDNEGEEAEFDIPCEEIEDRQMQTKFDAMKIIIQHATHFGVTSCPNRLLFSRNEAPKFVGMSAGIRSSGG